MTGDIPSGIAYVGSRTSQQRDGLGVGLTVYRTGLPGTPWTQIQVVSCDNPSYLIFNIERSVLYCAHGDTTDLSAFAVDPNTGELTLLNRIQSEGENPVHLTLSPDGRHLIVAGHNSGTISSHSLQDDGAIGPTVGIARMSGQPGPHRQYQNSSKPHQVEFDPSGLFAVVPDKGLDCLFVVTIAADGGLALDESLTVRLPEMAGPRHVRFHPTLPYLYSIDEFRSTVTAYRFDRDSSRIIPLQVRSAAPDTLIDDSRGAEIAVHPNGGTIYVSNRSGAGDHTPGGDHPDTIGVFQIDTSTGRLHSPKWVETAGIRPRFFCLDGSSQIIVAHERSHTIASHHIDEATGHPAAPRLLARTGSPVAVLLNP